MGQASSLSYSFWSSASNSVTGYIRFTHSAGLVLTAVMHAKAQPRAVLSISSLSARLMPTCSGCPQQSPGPSEGTYQRLLPIPSGPHTQHMSMPLWHLCSSRHACRGAEGRGGQG